MRGVTRWWYRAPSTAPAPHGSPRVARFEPATDADARAHERSFAALTEAIHRAEGTDRELFARRKPGPLTAVVLTLEEVYDQTPGPAAGVRLAPTAEAQ